MTTGKPDDIREQAKRIYFERCDEVNRLAARFEEEEVIDLLARAILAAKAEERESVAAYHDDLAARHEETREGLRGPTRANHGLMARVHRNAAAAIRKRGEVSTAHKNSEVQ